MSNSLKFNNCYNINKTFSICKILKIFKWPSRKKHYFLKIKKNRNYHINQANKDVLNVEK